VSAQNNLSHEQLSMFMTPKEIKSKFDVYRGEYDVDETTPKQLYSRKRRDAKHTNLFNSVQEHGVQEPVELSLGDRTVLDGHHRIASAKSKSLIPVTYLEPHEVSWRVAWK
jgi:hypothetical protein